jgi:2-phosphosulfolactate phosphatase
VRRVRVFASYRNLSAKAVADLDVVIVDVLRATTTIAFAVSRGARVLPLADEADALARGGMDADAILVGERMGKRLDGFHCNNSPCELGAFALGGRVVILTTTNGTQAVAACANARRIFAGALTNAPALGRHLCTTGSLERDLAIVCAGRNTGAIAYEDMLGAGAVVDAVTSAARPDNLWLADGARLARDLFTRERAQLASAVESSDAAQELLAQGNADVAEAATYGSIDSVAYLSDGMFVAA